MVSSWKTPKGETGSAGLRLFILKLRGEKEAKKEEVLKVQPGKAKTDLTEKNGFSGGGGEGCSSVSAHC